MGFKFIYSEGHSEVKGTKPLSAPPKVFWQWLCKPAPQEGAVTVAEGQSGGSVGMKPGLPVCFLATAASATGPQNKDGGRSQHLVSPWPLKSITSTCAPVYAHIHTLLCRRLDQGSPWGSWPVIWQSLTIAMSRCLGSRAKQMDGPSGFG